jgi:hypothetical protein
VEYLGPGVLKLRNRLKLIWTKEVVFIRGHLKQSAEPSDGEDAATSVWGVGLQLGLGSALDAAALAKGFEQGICLAGGWVRVRLEFEGGQAGLVDAA